MIKFDSLNHFGEVWLTSDLHYSHQNICRGTSAWDLEDHGGHTSVRDFHSIDRMNDAIIKGINDNVHKNDCLVILGDIAFSGKDKIDECCQRINTKNIILTFGNHDHNIRGNDYYTLTYFNNVLPANDTQYIQFKGVKVVCNHYPIAVWHQAHKGVLHAFGHVHGSFPGLNSSYDVGIDNALKDFGYYRPYSFAEFVEKASQRGYTQMSHHNTKTN